MDPRTISEIWTKLVKDGFFTTLTYEAERRYRKSIQHFSIGKESWILEVGCGTGRFHNLLRNVGFENIVSCDITFEHIARSRELNTRGLFVVARGESLPFRDSSFQHLVSNAAIEHFSAPEKGIVEFARVTEPGSQLVITSDCFVWRILQILGLYRSRMPVDKAIAFPEFGRMFDAASLEIVDFDAWGVTHYLRRLQKAIPTISSKLLESTQRDESWVNRKPRSYWMNRLRMVFLDENLFLLRNVKTALATSSQREANIDLASVLGCPVCKNAVLHDAVSGAFACSVCRVSYPLREGVPIMLVEQARPL